MEDQEFNGETAENQEGMEVPADNSSAVVDDSSEELEGTVQEPAEGTDGEAPAPDEQSEEGADAQPEETGADAEEEPGVTRADAEEEPAEAYSLENPMPVQIVEPAEEEYELEVYSLSGSYPGTISDTYLNYFRGIVQKLDWKEHYVVYRSGQYSYTMVYGEEVSLNGTRFTGTGNVVNIHRNSSSSSTDWYVSYSTDNLALSAGSLFVYSDLGAYPELKEGGTSLEFAALLFAVGFAVVYSVCHDIFDYVMEHVYRK